MMMRLLAGNSLLSWVRHHKTMSTLFTAPDNRAQKVPYSLISPEVNFHTQGEIRHTVPMPSFTRSPVDDSLIQPVSIAEPRLAQAPFISTPDLIPMAVPMPTRQDFSLKASASEETSSAEDRDWHRLETIFHKHQEEQARETHEMEPVVLSGARRQTRVDPIKQSMPSPNNEPNPKKQTPDADVTQRHASIPISPRSDQLDVKEGTRPGLTSFEHPPVNRIKDGKPNPLLYPKASISPVQTSHLTHKREIASASPPQPAEHVNPFGDSHDQEMRHQTPNAGIPSAETHKTTAFHPVDASAPDLSVSGEGEVEAEGYLQQMPLQDVWPVQRKDNSRTVPDARLPHPVEELFSPIPAEINKFLHDQPTEKPTDSAMEVIAPRFRRPDTQFVPPPAAPASQTEETSFNLTSPPRPVTVSTAGSNTGQNGIAQRTADTLEPAHLEMVKTEIGPLPADLWKILGQPVPQRDVVKADGALAIENTPDPSARTGSEKSRPLEKDIPLGGKPLSHEPSPSIQREITGGDEPVEEPVTSLPSGDEKEHTDTGEESRTEKLDINELARQVYVQIRRRLTEEWERGRH